MSSKLQMVYVLLILEIPDKDNEEQNSRWEKFLIDLKRIKNTDVEIEIRKRGMRLFELKENPDHYCQAVHFAQIYKIPHKSLYFYDEPLETNYLPPLD